MSKNPVLIVGGVGKTGRRVNARLKALGTATRPVSRSTMSAFDWNRPETWSARAAAASGAWRA